MKYNNVFITIVLCASLTQQVSFGIEERYQPQGWTDWTMQQMQRIKNAGSSLMSGLSSRMANMYNKISNLSTTTKAALFLTAAGTLIALGYDREVLKNAIDNAIDSTGNLVPTGLKMIQENQKAIGAMGLGAAGLYGAHLLKESAEKERKEEFIRGILQEIYFQMGTVAISSCVIILNELNEDKAAEWEEELKKQLANSKLAQTPLALNIPESINIKDLAIQTVVDKFKRLMTYGVSGEDNKYYKDDLQALKELKEPYAEEIKDKLYQDQAFINKLTQKSPESNIDDLTLFNIFEIIHGRI